jgi:hypothetical protein
MSEAKSPLPLFQSLSHEGFHPKLAEERVQTASYSVRLQLLRVWPIDRDSALLVPLSQLSRQAQAESESSGEL